MALWNLSELVHPSWLPTLMNQAETIARLEKFLHAEETAGRPWLPAPRQIFRALGTPLEEVSVIIVGQDPYPTPGHAVGLSFSVAAHTKPLPRSLINIYRELRADAGCTPAAHGDLQPWVDQGVLLLNRVLTVGVGRAGSHRNLGWEALTAALISACGQRDGPSPVAILWGRDAHTVAPLLPDSTLITSPHPSPLSAHRGFFGSRPFSRANTALIASGRPPIDWSLVPNR